MTDSIEVFFAAAEELAAIQREAGLATIGCCEADPRSLGGPLLLWGQDVDGDFYRHDPSGEWIPTTPDELRALYPHAVLPAWP